MHLFPGVFLSGSGFIANDEEDMNAAPSRTGGTRKPVRPRIEDDEEDEDEMLDYIAKRYGGREGDDMGEEAEASQVEQQALLPSVRDPKLWMVRIQVCTRNGMGMEQDGNGMGWEWKGVEMKWDVRV